MVDRLAAGDAEHRCDSLVRDIGRVRPEGIDLRQVPGQEDLEIMGPDEFGGIGDDAVHEIPVLLVAPQLRPPVLFARDYDGQQFHLLVRHAQQRTQPDLPAAVLHPGRDDDVEAEIHLAVPFRRILERGCHDHGIQHFRRHHFPILILDGLHDQQFPSVRIPDLQRIPHRHPETDLFRTDVIRHRNRRRHRTRAQRRHLPMGRARAEQQEQRQT